MKKSSLIILVVLLGLIALFSFQNRDNVTVQFFLFRWNTSQFVLIVASFVAGLLSGLLVSVTGYFRKRLNQEAGANKTSQANRKPEADNAVRDLEAEVADLKKEIAQLKDQYERAPQVSRSGGS
ncbi:MAG: LapA family protein [Syntrophorhabdaceae bacterium]|nr:LapA family protein [Syntrophorhabdaceae bacterium]